MLATTCISHLAGSVCNVVSLSLLLSFHVGQISFQNQPNALYTHTGGNVANKKDSPTIKQY